MYKTQKMSKIVLWVSIGCACFFGVIALILLTAPLWDQRQREDPEAQNPEQHAQQELLLGNDANNADDDLDPYRPKTSDSEAT